MENELENKINSNQNNRKQIRQIKKLKDDEIKKNQFHKLFQIK
jgi:hypothetical protein